ncbi:TPA: hypothetical protein JC757_004832 [Salmonella enterica subsp. diarizonae]|nr:hypothetical protein [Salmonella enterica subsp. diarizonae]
MLSEMSGSARRCWKDAYGLVDSLTADFLRNFNEQYLTVYMRVLAFSDYFHD